MYCVPLIRTHNVTHYTHNAIHGMSLNTVCAHLLSKLSRDMHTCMLHTIIHTMLNMVCRVGQNRLHAPYIAAYLVIFLPRIPNVPRLYMVPANPDGMSLNTVCAHLARGVVLSPCVCLTLRWAQSQA
jgi:hypothetical protein